MSHVMTTKVSTMWSQNLIIKIADEWDDNDSFGSSLDTVDYRKNGAS